MLQRRTPIGVLVGAAVVAAMTIEGRATALARKIGGKWLYVNDHAPVPAPAPPQAPSAKSGGLGK